VPGHEIQRQWRQDSAAEGHRSADAIEAGDARRAEGDLQALARDVYVQLAR
jgi:hypothetical protein